jgi:hypothetical protein
MSTYFPRLVAAVSALFTPAHREANQLRHIFLETNWLLFPLVIHLQPQSNCWIRLGTDA